MKRHLVAAGDFTKRVEAKFPDAELNSLASSVNNLVETVDRGLAETGTVLAALAQTDQATVRGTAMDPTGAVVPNATVELTNVGTNISRKITTNTNGDFEIPYVNPGRYRLTASATGRMMADLINGIGGHA